MILSLLTLKGGQGKTTLAINLAEECKAIGLDVCLVDADNQRSLTDFIIHRKVELCDFYQYESKEQLEKLSEKYHVVLVDNSPRVNEIFEEITEVSDFFIVPTRLDVFSFWANIELGKKLKSMKKKFYFLFNSVEYHQQNTRKEFEKALKKEEFSVFKQKISKSNDFLKSLNELKTLREIKSPKVAEIQLLLKEIERV